MKNIVKYFLPLYLIFIHSTFASTGEDSITCLEVEKRSFQKNQEERIKLITTKKSIFGHITKSSIIIKELDPSTFKILNIVGNTNIFSKTKSKLNKRYINFVFVKDKVLIT